jgi:protein-tyrosine phosphatase
MGACFSGPREGKDATAMLIRAAAQRLYEDDGVLNFDRAHAIFQLSKLASPTSESAPVAEGLPPPGKGQLPAAAAPNAHTSSVLVGGGAVATKADSDGCVRAAASAAVMRDGRHFAQFVVLKSARMYFGVIQSSWDVENGQDAERVDGHCFFATSGGKCYPGESAWEGMQSAQQPGDRIGLLLDLDAGSMAVYKNGARIGMMPQRVGMGGEYSWAVSMWGSGACVQLQALPLAAAIAMDDAPAITARPVSSPQCHGQVSDVAVTNDYDQAALDLFAKLNLPIDGNADAIRSTNQFTRGNFSGLSDFYSDLDAIWADPKTGSQVYIGNLTAAKSADILRSHNIRHVVNCQDVSTPNHHEGTSTFQYLRFPIAHWYEADTSTDAAVLIYFRACHVWIQQALDAGSSVLIHCTAGAHRAGATGVSWLMHVAEMTRLQATKAAQQRRFVVDPFGMLVEILEKFEAAQRRDKKGR